MFCLGKTAQQLAQNAEDDDLSAYLESQEIHQVHGLQNIYFNLVNSIVSYLRLEIWCLWGIFGLKCVFNKFDIPNLRIICISYQKF